MGATRIAFRRAFGAVLLLAGCNSDNQFQPTPDDGDNGPQIEVPAIVEFGNGADGETLSQVVTIGNVGNATLTVTSVLVESSAAFAVAFPQAEYLEPNTTVDVVVDYVPLNIEDNGILVVKSTDPAMPEAHVALRGGALLPVLQMEPNPMTFESVGICQTKNKTLTLTNVGTADLVLGSLTATGDGFEIIDDGLELPLTLAPNEAREVDVRFTPLSVIPYSGEVWATTNEAIGATSDTLSGEGAVQSRIEQTDTFRQPEGPYESTDIFFYVDRSLSMVNNLVNLADNFDVLLSSILSLDADYQIIVSTRGEGCSNGDIIDQDTVDAQSKFLEATRYGDIDEDWTEAGLYIAKNAFLESNEGGCNEGFLREGAKAVAVLVSDEPEQSDPGNDAIWAEEVDAMLGVAPTTSIVAIAGDVPDGCDNLADPGLGYWEASTLLTAGQFLSICTDDWAEHMTLIADLAAGSPTGTFVLSYLPDPATIIVSVGTTPYNTVVASSWAYDEPLNAVVFEDGQWPDSGAWVSIAYDLPTECETPE